MAGKELENERARRLREIRSRQVSSTHCKSAPPVMVDLCFDDVPWLLAEVERLERKLNETE